MALSMERNRLATATAREFIGGLSEDAIVASGFYPETEAERVMVTRCFTRGMRERFTEIAVLTYNERRREILRARRTPAEIDEERLRHVVQLLIRNIREENQAVVNFAERVADDAAYAFDSCENAMKAAAKQRVYRDMLHSLLRGLSLSEVHAIAERRVLENALYPPSSTSATSNLMALYHAAAYARLVEWLTIRTEK